MPGVEPNDRVINRYSIRNDAHPHGMLFDDLHLITIELPKLGNDRAVSTPWRSSCT